MDERFVHLLGLLSGLVEFAVGLGYCLQQGGDLLGAGGVQDVRVDLLGLGELGLAADTALLGLLFALNSPLLILPSPGPLHLHRTIDTIVPKLHFLDSMLPPHPLNILQINPRQMRPQNIILRPDVVQLMIQGFSFVVLGQVLFL